MNNNGMIEYKENFIIKIKKIFKKCLKEKKKNMTIFNKGL